MTVKDIVLAVIIPLILAEVSPWCGWLAARLLPLAARLRYGDTDRAAVRLEEWSCDLDEIPGQLSKLAYAGGQLVAGSAAFAGRRAGRGITRDLGLEGTKASAMAWMLRLSEDACAQWEQARQARYSWISSLGVAPDGGQEDIKAGTKPMSTGRLGPSCMASSALRLRNLTSSPDTRSVTPQPGWSGRMRARSIGFGPQAARMV